MSDSTQYAAMGSGDSISLWSSTEGSISVRSDNESFEQIKKMLKAGNVADAWDLAREAIRETEKVYRLLDARAPNGRPLFETDKVTGITRLNGLPIDDRVLEVAQKLIDAGTPMEPLKLFLQLLQRNPSYSSRKQTLDFMQRNGFLIDEQGYIIGLKAVKHDYWDKHTGKTFLNQVGCQPTMQRELVNDDPSTACSYGLHVGNWEYVRGFAASTDRIVVCKLDPMDVVSVPTYGRGNKLRCCSYLVVAELASRSIGLSAADSSIVWNGKNVRTSSAR